MLVLPGAASNQLYVIQIPFLISVMSILAGILFLVSLSNETRKDEIRLKRPTEEETKQSTAEYFKRITKGSKMFSVAPENDCKSDYVNYSKDKFMINHTT